MKKFKGKEIFIGIALAIILFGLFNWGVYKYSDRPEYQDYCFVNNSKTIYEPSDYAQCDEAYRQANNDFDNKNFYFFIIGGLLLSIAGLKFIKQDIFQITALGSGLGLIVEGVYQNFDSDNSFFIGVIVFLVLSYFVYKKYGGKKR